MNSSSKDARREVVLFLIFTFAFSGCYYAYLFLADNPHWSSHIAHAFMWCPGLAALTTRLILYRNLRGLGLDWARTKWYLPSVVVSPFLLVLIVYLPIGLLGLGQFDPSRLIEAASRFGLHGRLGSLALASASVLLIPVAVAISSISTFGEELGWRGLLVPRLTQLTSLTKTSLITGVIWSVWHYPLIFVLHPRFRPEIPLWYATLCFTITVTGISFPYTWLRLRSGSVWPAAFLHASSALAEEILEGLTKDTGITHYLTFEYGAGFAILGAVIGFLFYRRLDRKEAPAIAGR